MAGPVLGLSMSSVLTEVAEAQMAVPVSAAIPSAGWIQLADLGSLDRTLLRAWHLSRALPNQLELRYTEKLSTLSATERDATVRQRIGQDLFRDGLLTLWRGRCAISGLNVPELLRASHAKPWASSTDAERLDVYNGLLLAAHLDAAFDCGLITVEADGAIGLSPTLPVEALSLLRLDAGVSVSLSSRHEPYLAWHRQRVFRR
jgi:predicted restriction endonuclease